MLTKDQAVCIRDIDYSETSQIVTFFTKESGKINAIAKGSKRAKSAFDGPIEVFSHGKIVFAGSNKDKLATLTEFEQQPALTCLSKDYLALNCALFAAELVSNLTHDYDPHPELFDHFLQFLGNLNQTPDTPDDSPDTLALLIIFQLALLRGVGLQPILNACANCKHLFRTDWPECYFSSSANGLICRDCQASYPDKMRLTAAAANCLSNLKLMAESHEKILHEIEKVLVCHFTELLHKTPRMAKYILKARTG
ncbi:MAG: DNA repair protein RecO [Planctomycetota bacterium]|jgi:DNA repair protein RecO (recombination protein O)